MARTPHVRKSSKTGPYTSNHYFSSPKMERMAYEMSSKFVEHMPPKQFLAEFLPLQAGVNKPRAWNGALQRKFGAVANKTKETEMYKPLVDAFTVACSDRLILVDTSSHVDTDCGILVPEGLKPDISAYEPDYQQHQPKEKKVADFSLLEVHMELKKSVMMTASRMVERRSSAPHKMASTPEAK